MNITAIIPYYRAAATIGRAVESILAQTVLPREIIVVNDGSPDDPKAALRPYAGRLRLVHQENGGAASARNRGIDLAQGDFIAFLDSDDYWEAARLETQQRVLERHPEVGLIASWFFEEWPGRPRRFAERHNAGVFDRVWQAGGADAFHIARCLWTGTVLVRRALLAEQRFVSGLEPAEDVDLWIRLVASTPTYILSDPLATYVQGPGSLSNASVDRDCGNFLRVIHRHADLLGPAALRRWEALAWRRWAGNHLARGDARAALGPSWRRLMLEPWRVDAWKVLTKCALLTAYDPRAK